MYLIHLTCSNCNFKKLIELELDKNGVYSIANLFCPKCLRKLDRELQDITAATVEPVEQSIDEPDGIDEPGGADEPGAD